MLATTIILGLIIAIALFAVAEHLFSAGGAVLLTGGIGLCFGGPVGGGVGLVLGLVLALVTAFLGILANVDGRSEQSAGVRVRSRRPAGR